MSEEKPIPINIQDPERLARTSRLGSYVQRQRASVKATEATAEQCRTELAPMMIGAKPTGNIPYMRQLLALPVENEQIVAISQATLNGAADGHFVLTTKRAVHIAKNKSLILDIDRPKVIVQLPIDSVRDAKVSAHFGGSKLKIARLAFRLRGSKTARTLADLAGQLLA